MNLFDFIKKRRLRKKHYSKDEIKQIMSERGSFKTFLICENCGYVQEKELPKGFVVVDRNLDFSFAHDELTGRRTHIFGCPGCETSSRMSLDKKIIRNSNLIVGRKNIEIEKD